MSSELVKLLKRLEEIEENALEVYGEVFGELDDAEAKAVIGEIMKSEDTHRRLVMEALRIAGDE